MERVAFVMRVKPGYEEEYIKRHKNVFPELLEAFKKVGIHNYSIFMDGNCLFAYQESDNYAKARQELVKEPIFKKWQEYMSPIMLNFEDTGSVSRFIKEVFHAE